MSEHGSGIQQESLFRGRTTALAVAGVLTAATVVGAAVAGGTWYWSWPRPDRTVSFNFQRDGLTNPITVDCFLPPDASATRRYPVVLHLHGVDGAYQMQGRHYRDARDLADEGYIVCFVHYFDACDYDHLLQVKDGELDVEFINGHVARDRRLWSEVVAKAARFAVTLPEARSDRVGLVGCSLGCFVAIDAAAETLARDDVPDAAALIGHWGCMWEGAKFPPGYPPTRLFIGGSDPIIRGEWVEQTLTALRSEGVNAAATFYPGQKHILTGAAAEDAQAQTIAFLAQTLAAP